MKLKLALPSVDNTWPAVPSVTFNCPIPIELTTNDEPDIVPAVVERLEPSERARENPPAVVPSWTTTVFKLVLTVISPAKPMNDECSEVVPLLL